MERFGRGLAWKGGAITVILLLLMIILWANLNSMIAENCFNQIVSEVPSPDGKTKAVIFQRKCGLDTAPSTHVTLLPSTESLPNRKGNVFIAEDNAKRAGVNISWKNPAAIDLSYPARLRVLRKANDRMGVTIFYSTAASKAHSLKK